MSVCVVLNLFSVVLTVKENAWSAIRIRRWNAEIAVLHQFDHAGVLDQLVDELRFENSKKIQNKEGQKPFFL